MNDTVTSLLEAQSETFPDSLISVYAEHLTIENRIF